MIGSRIYFLSAAGDIYIKVYACYFGRIIRGSSMKAFGKIARNFLSLDFIIKCNL